MHVKDAVVEFGEILLELRIACCLLGQVRHLAVEVDMAGSRAGRLLGTGADGLRQTLLMGLGRGSGQSSKLGELELEAHVVEVIDGGTAKGLGAGLRGRLGGDKCHPLLVVVELSSDALNLSTEHAVLMVGGFGSLLQLLDLGLKVLEVLLLPLSESTLGSAILSLALLQVDECQYLI